MLFLWLAMLGAAIAFRRGEHMRMTALVSKSSPGARAFLDVVAVAGALAFLAIIMPYSFEYAAGEAMIRTPALDLQNSWRASAMFAGFAS